MDQLSEVACLTVYAADPTPEPCMILAIMVFVRETSTLNTVCYEWPSKSLPQSLIMGHFFMTQPNLTQDFRDPTRPDPVGIGQWKTL